MAYTTPPKKENNTVVLDIFRREGSSDCGTISEEVFDVLFALKAKAIAEDKSNFGYF